MVNNRTRLSLDGQWQFWTDPDDSLDTASLLAASASQVHVPAPWQSQSSKLISYTGVAWYQRTLEIPIDWIGSGRILLGIDASDYKTEVWFNGMKVGEHEGGYLPFESDVTLAAFAGENTLTIRVDDPPAIFPEVPHGKQGWYGPLSGIWQSVWLECRPETYISQALVTSELKSGCVDLEVKLTGAGECSVQLEARVLAPDGRVVASSNAPFKMGSCFYRFGLQVENPKAWSLETPNLYTLEVKLTGAAGETDLVSKRFGFRHIETRDGKIYLNGEPIYLRAALDQDYYPDTIYTTPDEAFLEDQARKAKELGLNCLRCHIKVADPRYYDVADRMGLLVWTEIPNWTTFTQSAGERGRETMKGILERDGHHPSIVIWTIINENWGTDLVNNASHRAWLRDTYFWLKRLDPTRLVVDNSPCEPSFHVASDIEDYHFYRGIPDHRKEWDKFVNDFASRAPWTYSPHGDIMRSGEEPLIVSEFGNWGLPDADLLVDENGRDPWWFDTGMEWGEGVVYPQGVRGRFQNLALEKIFGSWQAFIEATQRQQFVAMKYQIEAMRLRPEINGYVITELTDVHWESNGLLDMRRNPKAYHYDLAAVNTDTVVLPGWKRLAYWSGETVEIDTSVSHGHGPALKTTEVRWWLAGTPLGGCLDSPDMQAGEVKSVGKIAFTAPDQSAPAVRRLVLELRGKDNELLATNYVDLSIYPRREGPPERLSQSKATRLFTHDTGLSRALSQMGYEQVSDMQSAHVVVVGKADAGLYTRELTPYVLSGGRLLVLADRAGEDGPLMAGIRREKRFKTPWAGDWASSFSWIRRRGPFARLAGEPMLDHGFDRVIPDHVLVGFRDWEFQALVKAGIVVGWVHKPAAFIGERLYGKGKAVFSAFRLEDEALCSDPTATTLMDALIEYAQ